MSLAEDYNLFMHGLNPQVCKLAGTMVTSGALEEVIEPYLLQQGLIQRTPRHRLAPVEGRRVRLGEGLQFDEAGICRPGHDEEVVQHQSFNPGQLWVFLGIDSDFPAAVFSERDKAESWINRYKLNGNVILYPVDITLYDRAIQNNYISGDNPEVSTKEFISNYTPDRLKQLVYQEGILKGHIQHDGKRQNYFTV